MLRWLKESGVRLPRSWLSQPLKSPALPHPNPEVLGAEKDGEASVSFSPVLPPVMAPPPNSQTEVLGYS